MTNNEGNRCCCCGSGGYGKRGCKLMLLFILIKIGIGILVFTQGKERLAGFMNMCPDPVPCADTGAAKDRVINHDQSHVPETIRTAHSNSRDISSVTEIIRTAPLNSIKVNESFDLHPVKANTAATRANTPVRIETAPLCSPFQAAVPDILKGIPSVANKSDNPQPYRPRIMCMIFTTEHDFYFKARSVNDTWAKRCDIHRFFLSTTKEKAQYYPDVVPVTIPDGREHLTAKTNFALRHAYLNFKNDADWFFKADDDTYVIMENLRAVVSQFDPQKSHYIGGKSHDLLEHGYNGGGAGYALSKAAVYLLVEEGHRFPLKCKQDGGYEDLDIGACLEQFRVYPLDTRDAHERLTFHCDHPYKIFANQGDSRRVYTYRKTGNSYPSNLIRVMSPHTVTFHYVEWGLMYMYDFMLYDLQRRQDWADPQSNHPS